MPENPFKEIPIQDNRPPVKEDLTFDPDVHEWLTHYQTGRGTRDYIVNYVLRMYRDALPANRRGAAPATAGSPQQAANPHPAKASKAGSNG